MAFLFCAMAMSLASQQSSRPPQLQNVNRIVMMGDSITQFGGPPKGYVTLVTESLDANFGAGSIEVINAGISGQKAPDMEARFQTDVLDRHPQLLTLSVGVNDVWHNFRNAGWTARVATGDSGRGVALPDYVKDVEEMVTMAQRAGVKVVLLSPTLVYEDLNCAENNRLTEYVHAEQAIASRTHATFVNLNEAFRKVIAQYQREAGKRNLLLTKDGVHMNDAGNALMADLVLKALGVKPPDEVSPH
jgi:lysophospholipase L1-like esterase